MSELDQAVETEVEVDETELAIRDAFNSAIEGEADEDSIKLGMISAGATFKNVTRLYNQFMIDAGLAISKQERNELIDSTLEGKEFDTEESFNSAVEALIEAIVGTTERSAAAMIRAYAKKNELDCFAKTTASTGERQDGFKAKFYKFLESNPLMSRDEAMAFINGEGDHDETSNNVKKHASNHIAVWKLVNDIATKTA